MQEYRYTLKNTGYSSAMYGKCEVCGKKASEVYHQTEERKYTRPDGSIGWTRDKCNDSVFGHKSCLMKLRRGVREKVNRKPGNIPKDGTTRQKVTVYVYDNEGAALGNRQHVVFIDSGLSDKPQFGHLKDGRPVVKMGSNWYTASQRKTGSRNIKHY